MKWEAGLSPRSLRDTTAPQTPSATRGQRIQQSCAHSWPTETVRQLACVPIVTQQWKTNTLAPQALCKSFGCSCFQTGYFFMPSSGPTFSLWFNFVCPSKSHSNAPSSFLHPGLPWPLQSPTPQPLVLSPTLAPSVVCMPRPTPSPLAHRPSQGVTQGLASNTWGAPHLGGFGGVLDGALTIVHSLPLLGEGYSGAKPLIRFSKRPEVLRR